MTEQENSHCVYSNMFWQASFFKNLLSLVGSSTRFIVILLCRTSLQGCSSSDHNTWPQLPCKTSCWHLTRQSGHPQLSHLHNSITAQYLPPCIWDPITQPYTLGPVHYNSRAFPLTFQLKSTPEHWRAIIMPESYYHWIWLVTMTPTMQNSSLFLHNKSL